MAKLVSLLISARQQRDIAIAIGFLVFALLLVASTFLAATEARRSMRAQSRFALEQYAQLRINLDDTFGAITTQVTAAPCTRVFQSQLRRVAFLPDGFSEFLYVPNGRVECSLSVISMATPVALGDPDIAPSEKSPSEIWIDRGLGFAGLQGLVGSIVKRGDFAIVVPPQKPAFPASSWFEREVVLNGTDGRYWHRAGEVEVYDHYKIAQGPRAPWLDTTLRALVCDEYERYCVASEASAVGLFQTWKVYVFTAITLLAIISAWLAGRVKSLIVKRWSFEARFRRHLDAESVICVYQPIIDVGTGAVVGCEILARWRDVDDSIVYPDRFIPLVEKHGLTAKFTRLVVQRAFAELSKTAPCDRKLKLTFNIFPRDLKSEILLDIFKVFKPLAGRFDIVVELVESDQIDIEDAQRQIETLRKAGIGTYIDDFGTGYSNIQNLAGLTVAGVKLDRAFAMAPDGSLMAKMLLHAIEMIHESGRAIVIEGVETAERLESLRQLVPPVDFAQGYFISRPLDVERFAVFVAGGVPIPGRLQLAA